MKRCLFVVSLLSMAFLVDAQRMSNAEIQKQMQLAQKKIDSIKKANPQAAQMLQNVNVQAMYQKLNSQVTAGQQKLQKVKEANLSSVPKSKPVPPVSGFSAMTAAEVKQVTSQYLNKITASLTPDLKIYLNKIANDTSLSVAGTGTMMSACGMPKTLGDYLICKAVLKKSNDYLALNDLGVALAQDGQYRNGIRCLLYALNLSHSSAAVLTNLGWCSANYGDLQGGKKFFEKAVTADKKMRNAIEGLGMVNFSLGNKQEVKHQLQQDFIAMGSAGPAPSESFVRTCGGVIQEENAVNLDNQPDPNADETFDPLGEQPPPPGAEVDNVLYPSYKGLFPNSVNDLEQANAFALQLRPKTIEEITQLQKRLAADMESIPPLVPAPTRTGEQTVVVPRSFAPLYETLVYNHELFERRIYWFNKKFTDKLPALVGQIGQRDEDFIIKYFDELKRCEAAYEEALKGCNSDDACEKKAEMEKEKCVNAVDCEYVPRAKGMKNSDIAAISSAWSAYFEQIINTINWYIKTSSPLISRIHDVRWNQHANMLREVDVRKAVLVAYENWMDALLPVASNGTIVSIALKQIDCKVDMPTMGGGADPFSKKVGKLKTFAGPCYTVPLTFDLLVVKYEDNCEHTAITVATGPIKSTLERVYSKKFKEDNYWKIGGTINLSTGPSIKEKFGGMEISAGAKLGVEISSSRSLNDNFETIGKTASIDVSTELGAGTKGVIGKVIPSLKISADSKVEYVMGPGGTESKISGNIKLPGQ